RYPVVILEGNTNELGVRAGLEGGEMLRFPAFKGRYTALCELKPGKNYVVVKAGANLVKLLLEYKPMKTPYRVQAVWTRASDEEGTPAHILPHGDYRAKLDVAMKLMQAFTAEAMDAAGYGRKTFPLEFDSQGKVVVHVLKLSKTGKEMRAMEGGQSWSTIYQALEKQIPGPTNKWVSINAFTGYDAAAAKWAGHYALGGGQLAAFGGGNVAYWPDSLSLVAKTLANRERIDPKKNFEDSRFRETVWANVSTALGATLHELGHTFGLPHSPDPQSVMSRGFDYFNRSFMAYEPPYKGNDKEMPVQPNQRTKWDPFFAARLNWNPWFQPDVNRRVESTPPSIQIQEDEVTVKSQAGLRVVGADRDDTPAFWQNHRDRPVSEVRLDRKELLEKMGGKEFRISAVDSDGNQTTIDVKP
ncbi:MAG TPA: matrixin family metalloprotease, partial [Fimbriimonas sp.]